jgi:AraC-like DNA-binding protein
MLYVDPASVSAALDGAAPPFVPDVVADDPALAELVGEAFADFPGVQEPLAFDAIVERLAGLLAARSDGLKPPRSSRAQQALRRARDFLVAEAHRTVSSEELEKVTGLDRFTLSRQFRTLFGTSPHRFQVGQRLSQAQALIAAGTKLSEAAAATGFADQSHLTRHFVARFGLTPGRWAALLPPVA